MRGDYILEIHDYGCPQTADMSLANETLTQEALGSICLTLLVARQAGHDAWSKISSLSNFALREPSMRS
jgi:hypothetical protein